FLDTRVARGNRALLLLTAEVHEQHRGVVHLVLGRRHEHMAGDKRWDLLWGKSLIALESGIQPDLRSEFLFVIADPAECLIQINPFLLAFWFVGSDVEAHQVAIAVAIAEPAPHLHQRVRSPRDSSVVTDG